LNMLSRSDEDILGLSKRGGVQVYAASLEIVLRLTP
jgi:hypothetical protein